MIWVICATFFDLIFDFAVDIFMTDRYCVVGTPIAHSLSPKLHQIFAEQTGQDIVYFKQEIPPGQFENHMQVLLEAGVKGFNVTLPFKEEAFRWVDFPSDETRLMGALNTIKVLPEGKTQGFSTDGIGLVRDLEKSHGLILKNKRILLLGAGGAARSVMPELIKQGCREIVISNRTPEKAVELAVLFNASACEFSELSKRQGLFDLVINATSVGLFAGLSQEEIILPNGLIDESSLCYDMVYGKGLTRFLIWGKNSRAKTSDGLGMLIEQGAESFYIWRGIRPETQGIRAKILEK